MIIIQKYTKFSIKLNIEFASSTLPRGPALRFIVIDQIEN